jgi:2-polyprenyl-3-methyl-5-hydroxy-6-metoxy-1,4-benzoquinol methylase
MLYKSDLKDPFDWFFGYYDKPHEWWDKILLAPEKISQVVDEVNVNDCDTLLVSDSPSSSSPHQVSVHVVSESRLKSSVRIMMIGCGHSSLSVDLFKEGYTNMVSVDSSQEVIAYMA